MEQSTLLVVDDTPDNIKVISGLLRTKYRLKAASSGEKALQLAVTEPIPDLILLDIMMPGMDGYEVCERLKADPRTQDIPVIFLTAKTQPEDEQKGLELGAVDYISKPISPLLLSLRVATHLQLKLARDLLKHKNEILEQRVEERTRQISALQDVTIYAMGALAETRDPETGNHLRRTQLYIEVLARQLKDHPRFRDTLTPEYIALLYKCAPLHDIGKVGIPDSILLKPEPLTHEEFEVMKRHTVLARDAILSAEKSLDRPEPFLTVAREIALYHHEKWDGSGYPEGLQGEAIPVCARLMALADVYDALISRRVYKEAFSHTDAFSIILKGRGSVFDPDIVTAFEHTHEQFLEISQRLLG